MQDDELGVRVPGSEVLHPSARSSLQEALARYGALVLQEAERLEAASHVGPGPAMITPSMITDSEMWVRRGYSKPKKSGPQQAAIAASYFMAILCGYFVNNIDKAWGSIGFAVCATAGVIAHIRGGQA
ncbi:hypothetical protein [Micromonospora purpureochromogenes]|uniref:Uncharacterized protein n=1 Tax=Micromonospora purpureochromogenes TaxID=47872 RepID=A0ABX2RMX7_9ACTN|nr:hypothetical protein [Micromonospora purpureochromogenes]NYF56563.1 hypothetical protein [Micromonospora purpureochromogenes]